MAPTLPRLETLYDGTTGPPIALPDGLRAAYGGELRFPEGDAPYVFANFVSTLDGLVSYGTPGSESARLISRGHAGDRFVMGLLRASADAVIAGAGTLRVEPKVTWAPGQIFPPAAGLYAEVRRARALPDRVRVALLTASGDVDLAHPLFRSADVDALVVTSVAGAARLAAAGPGAVRVVAVGEGAPTMREAVDAVADAFGARLILSEAGPTIFGRMLRERAIDELFLTLAPRLGGRSGERPGVSLVEDSALGPEGAPEAALLGAKRSEDHLLLRYRLER